MEQAVRAARLADQIRDYLAEWAARDMPGSFFSITQVTLHTDLSVATAWIDVLRPEEGDTVMRSLEQHLPAYQRRLGRALRRRLVPRLHIRKDDQATLEIGQ